MSDDRSTLRQEMLGFVVPQKLKAVLEVNDFGSLFLDEELSMFICPHSRDNGDIVAVFMVVLFTITPAATGNHYVFLPLFRFCHLMVMTSGCLIHIIMCFLLSRSLLSCLCFPPHRVHVSAM